jgi:carbamate kinase
MRIVAALGGNALLRRGEPIEAGTQLRNVTRAAQSLALLAQHHGLVITHGNGPQVGLLALQAAAYRTVAPYPLDILNAESEGMIGYLIERELAGLLPGRDIATLLTQVEVDPDDSAFVHPTKPIGPVYDSIAGDRIAAQFGWRMAPDGAGVRRVVPSPEPQRVLEINTILHLLRVGVIVICAGGGGIPIARQGAGYRGVEAVIDKDPASALLAIELKADALLLLTDVDAVYRDWGTNAASAIRRATAAEMRRLAFAAGSMGPKVDAACRFAERSGRPAAIGALEKAGEVLAGEAGTTVIPG